MSKSALQGKIHGGTVDNWSKNGCVLTVRQMSLLAFLNLSLSLSISHTHLHSLSHSPFDPCIWTQGLGLEKIYEFMCLNLIFLPQSYFLLSGPDWVDEGRGRGIYQSPFLVSYHYSSSSPPPTPPQQASSINLMKMYFLWSFVQHTHKHIFSVPSLSKWRHISFIFLIASSWINKLTKTVLTWARKKTDFIFMLI